jgi:hypothetical protein
MSWPAGVRATQVIEIRYRREVTAYAQLPKGLLSRASLRGNEYAWRVEDIPEVIIAARDANLLNIGGQLQFRLPDGVTCECYWIDVDTHKSVPSDQDWDARVAQSAATALADFKRLQAEFDFIAEGKQAFDKHLAGENPDEAMWFVWYVKDQGVV